MENSEMGDVSGIAALQDNWIIHLNNCKTSDLLFGKAGRRPVTAPVNDKTGEQKTT
jgi:hypothetical protein